ncbi:MAG: bifunctional 3-deoxy-7-phosphoheptulonate synthase/chorismate mutase type II [Bacteroidia bacterium]|nr:bifunctional 3-deoxy-7-phosphoheptulonate synthase/chorismate mutase type II [Bacteroidia bacterium]
MDRLPITPLRDWGLGLEDSLNIFGPCSVESPEQVMETVQGLADSGVHIIRGGIWKPRTRPNSFEGVGSPGLKWLKDAGAAIGKPVMTEVANVKHVYEALRCGIDVLWLGARTTTNPFAVQEIADALEGVDIPVLVKNPVNPDLELWVGAIERLNRAGIHKVAAIHRGFSAYGKSKYRNPPQWEVPIEMRRRHPEVPIVVDPSHICGNRELLASVAQKGLDLDFDGVMLEVHITPDKALSDAKQQITPERLKELLAGLVRRSPDKDDASFHHLLEVLRENIDDMDRRIIDLLAERMRVARQIGQVKKDNNITILQYSRWNEILQDRLSYAGPKGISADIMTEILQNIHKESIRHQAEVMNTADA